MAYEHSYHFTLFLIGLSPALLLDVVAGSVLVCLLIVRRFRNSSGGNSKENIVPLLPVDKNGKTKKKKNKKKVEPQSLINRWIALLAWLLVFSVAYVGCVTVVFDYLPAWVGASAITLLMWICWALLIPYTPLERRPASALMIFQDEAYDKSALSKFGSSLVGKAKERPVLFWGGAIYLLVMVFATCFLGSGICITADPVSFSTRFTRHFDKDPCDIDQPCHVYLTMTEDPSTSMFVNFHVKHSKLSEVGFLYYDTVSHSNGTLSDYGMTQEVQSLIQDTLDLHRVIHWIRLDNLLPNTIYYFRAGYSSDVAYYSDEKYFLTAPSTGPFTFVTGGDMSVSQTAMMMTAQAAQLDPLFAMVGGDMAYANAFSSCYQRWDTWLFNWEQYMTNAGRLIPMILALGNHESGGYNINPATMPFYEKWFPQGGIGNQGDRTSYHAHTFSGNTLIMALDSGLALSTADPTQSNWMKEQFALYASYPNKAALYHVPLYPSSTHDRSQTEPLKNMWLDLFDSNNLTIAFENHDHTYKRTKFLKGDKEDATGTLYSGDGCWGVDPRTAASPGDRWYLARTESTNFVLRVDVNGTTLNMKAIDITGKTFDAFSISH